MIRQAKPDRAAGSCSNPNLFVNLKAVLIVSCRNYPNPTAPFRGAPSQGKGYCGHGPSGSGGSAAAALAMAAALLPLLLREAPTAPLLLCRPLPQASRPSGARGRRGRRTGRARGQEEPERAEAGGPPRRQVGHGARQLLQPADQARA